MTLHKLITHFQTKKELPIKIDDIRKWIIDNGFQDEVVFIPTKIDPKILKGIFRQYTKHNDTKHNAVYGEPIWVTEVLYSEELNQCWERFVCCKEMLHIFDREESRTSAAEQISELIFSLTSPKYTDQLNHGAWADYDAVISALHVLAPISIIDALWNDYERGTKNAYDIALFLRIPEIYIPFLMSDIYKNMFELRYENKKVVKELEDC